METVPKTGTTAGQGMTIASVLAVIGGAIMIAGVIGGGMMFSFWDGGGMMGGGMMSDTFMWGAIAGVGAIWAGTGVVTVIGGYAIYRRPESAGTWGVAILIASIVGLVSMSGFFVGPILGIIAGILALARK